MKFNDRPPQKEDDISLKMTQSHEENILLRAPSSPEDLSLTKTQSNADYCANCGAFKQDNFHICVNAVAASTAFSDRHLGQIVGGHYVIDQKLGEGGMSVVYRAKHELLNKVVAVKVLKANLSMDRGKLARFQQEAMSVSKLNHPNIIRVYHFEVPAKSEPYLIMDYVEGEPLSDILEREGPMPLERTVSIFSRVCDALAHAHDAGIVHRDIKPSNIIIGINEDGSESVKIVDFGIAKIVTGEPSQQNVTQTGEVFGSPLYMSPEQCAAKQMDARSDIYSTACVIYECLTGKPPLMGTSALETMQMHVFEMPENIAKHRPDVVNGAQLDALMFKALAKHPARRHESMREMQLELEALLENKNTGVVSDAMARLEAYQRKRGARAWKRKVQPYLVPLIAASIGLFAVSGLAIYQALNPPRDFQSLNLEGQELFNQGKYAEARNRFESAFEVAKHSTPEKKTDQMVSILQELTDLDRVQNVSPSPILAQLAALHIVPSESSTAATGTQELKNTGKNAPSSQTQGATVAPAPANTATSTEGPASKTAGAETQIEAPTTTTTAAETKTGAPTEAAAAETETVAPTKAAPAGTAVPRTIAAKDTGTTTTTTTAAPTTSSPDEDVSAVDTADGANAAHNVVTATAFASATDPFESVYSAFRSAGASSSQVQDMLSELANLKPEQAQDADGIVNRAIDLAGIEYAKGNLSSTEKLASAALAASHRVYGEPKRADLRALFDLALVSSSHSDFEAAKNFAQQCIDLSQKLTEPQPQLQARSYLLLAEVACREGKFDEALKLTDQAAGIFRQVEGATSKWMAMCHFRSGMAYQAKQKYSLAESELKQSLDILKQLPPETVPGGYIDAQLTLGRLKMNNLNDLAGAETLFTQAVSQLEAHEPKSVPDWLSLSKALTDMAYLQNQNSNFAAALAMSERAAAISLRVDPAHGETYADALRGKAQAQWQLHRKGNWNPDDETVFRQAIESTKSVYTASETQLIPLLQEQAMMYFAHKDFAKAEQVLRNAIALQPTGGNPELYAKTQNLLNSALARQGKAAQADPGQK